MLLFTKQQHQLNLRGNMKIANNKILVIILVTILIIIAVVGHFLSIGTGIVFVIILVAIGAICGVIGTAIGALIHKWPKQTFLRNMIQGVLYMVAVLLLLGLFAFLLSVSYLGWFTHQRS